MPIERKIYKIGGSLAVLLPKGWCKHNNIKKGDDVLMEIDGMVKIYPKSGE